MVRGILMCRLSNATGHRGSDQTELNRMVEAGLIDTGCEAVEQRSRKELVTAAESRPGL